MSDHVCQIYVLFNLDGEVNYVGRTKRDIRKRLTEHKRVLGYLPIHEIVDRCSENCREVERRWIERYRSLGCALRNISYGQGPHFCAESTREKLRMIFTGRPMTWGAKISATQKGQQRNWSDEGRRRVAATQFKPGESRLGSLSEEAQARHRAGSARAWTDPEKRRRMSNGGWACLTLARRSELMRRGWITRKANLEKKAQ